MEEVKRVPCPKAMVGAMLVHCIAVQLHCIRCRWLQLWGGGDALHVLARCPAVHKTPGECD